MNNSGIQFNGINNNSGKQNITQNIINSNGNKLYKLSEVAEPKFSFSYLVSILANIFTIIGTIVSLFGTKKLFLISKDNLTNQNANMFFVMILTSLIFVFFSILLFKVNFKLLKHSYALGIVRDKQNCLVYKPKRCLECDAKMRLNVEDTCYECKRNKMHKFYFDYTKL